MFAIIITECERCYWNIFRIASGDKLLHGNPSCSRENEFGSGSATKIFPGRCLENCLFVEMLPGVRKTAALDHSFTILLQKVGSTSVPEFFFLSCSPDAFNFLIIYFLGEKGGGFKFNRIFLFLTAGHLHWRQCHLFRIYLFKLVALDVCCSHYIGDFSI